ncbi:MAG: hypothetical protein AAGE52_19415 [Myxococcota bacterium]
MRLHLRIDEGVVLGTNAAVDVSASLPRFLAELRRALGEEFPHVELDVGLGESRIEVEGEGDHATIRLRVQGVVRAVRHCGDWVVYE